MKKNYIRIEGHPEYVKDTESGAILNVDNNALKQHKINRSKRFLEEKRIIKLEDDIIELKTMLKEILKNIRKDN